ncbi:MAG: WG repeat-containing protein [Saprospiraceae bacterium]|nr:WG repeat-containing protein [Saprospiraceae bacterium]
MMIILYNFLGMLFSIPHYGQGPHAQKDQFGKWGLVSEDGMDLTAFEFDKMKAAGPYFLVESAFAWGAIDQLGSIVVPQKYLDIRVSGPDMFIVKKGTFGVLDQQGQPILEPELETVQYIRDDGAALIKRMANGFILKTMNT